MQHVLLHIVYGRQRCRAGERIAAEGRAVHAYDRRDTITGQHGPDGYAATKRLCETQNVGADPVMLAGEHGTGAAQTGLYFIDDQ